MYNNNRNNRIMSNSNLTLFNEENKVEKVENVK